MKILWIVPGFGKPNLEEKERIVENNKLMVGNDYSIDMEVYKYTDDKPGIVGQFLKTFCSPARVNQYDCVMLSLDDIEFTKPVPWEFIMENLKKYDIISPSLEEDSFTTFPHMKNNRIPDEISKTSCAEFFCYFMTPKAYATWWGYIRDYNPWLWGMELCSTKVMNLTVGIMKNYQIKHWFHGGSNGFKDRTRYLEEMKVSEREVSDQPTFY